MGLITGPSFLSFDDLYTSWDTLPSGYALGMKAYGVSGQIYRLALAGGSNLVKGNLLQNAVADSQFVGMSIPATQTAVTNGGVQTVQVTNGSTVVTANQFDGGSLVVSTTPDGGSEYTILGHTTDASGSGTLTLTLDRPIKASWTTSTKVNMKRNPWSSVIQWPGTATGFPVGVAIYAIPTTKYGWVQTHGMCAVLSDATTFNAGTTIQGSATAGAVGLVSAATKIPDIGIANDTNSSTKWVSVFLQID